ncbi:MAG: phage portal protein [Lentisphaerae bacterium]|nr:phage portal protein [Lentisphaerota bacterium]
MEKKEHNAILPKPIAPAKSRRVYARYNAASTSADSARNFSGTDYLSADAAMTRHVRRLISARARNEFANNSFAYGIIWTLADDTIGTGPRLQLEPSEDMTTVMTTDPALQRRERRFHAWARAVKLNALLRCARIAKAVDGETFIWLQVNKGARRDVPLEPKLYEAEYVTSDLYADQLGGIHRSGVPVEVDGIVYDPYGNPLTYKFARVHPGQSGIAAYGRPFEVPASQVIHYANIFRPGQHRGLSEMTAALHIFNDLRRYSTAVVLAAEVSARLSFIISNDLPPEVYTELYGGSLANAQDGDPQSLLDKLGGLDEFRNEEQHGLILPDGYKAMQLKSEQPTAQYVTFKDAKIAEAARVFSMPFNVAAGDSSSYNYASGRLDHQVYHKKLLIERETISQDILDPILAAWEEYDRAQHPDDYAHETTGHYWMFDGFEHVDPIKEANAQAARLTNGVTTMAEECAREGRDYHSILRQRKREIEECRHLGIDPMPWMNAGAVAFAPDAKEEPAKEEPAKK